MKTDALTRAGCRPLEGFDPRRRGYSAVFRPGERTRCPGCDRSQWIVRTITAECAFCSTALPIAAPERRTVFGEGS